TVAMNDSVGIAGPLFAGGNNGKPNPAGIAADATSPALLTIGAAGYSYPQQLANNIIWHNRSFYANLYGSTNPPNNVGLQGTATTYYTSARLCSANNVSDVNNTCPVQLSTSLAAGQTALSTLATGQCDQTNERYWDLGLVNDTSAAPGANKLNPQFSVLTSATGYSTTNNTTNDPLLVKPYCNSSQAISASSDEQGNFVDFRYGPLSQTAPVAYPAGTPGTATAAGAPFGSYALAGTSSSAYNAGTASGAPNHDFVGTTRPQGGKYDIGAFELPVATVQADLAITVTDGRTTVYRGDSLTYSIVVTNNGPGSASGAIVTAARPAGITAGSWSWTCAPAAGCGTTANSGNGDINTTLGTLASGASVTITATGRVASNATGSITSTASVAAPAGMTDPVTTNNNATDTDTIVVGTRGAVAFTAASKGRLIGNGAGRTLSFGGSAGSSTVTLTVTGASVTFGAASVANLLGSAFTLTNDGCAGKTVSAVAGSNSCSVTVAYAGGGFALGRLSAADSAAGGGPQTLNLSGL
ncbi:MAG: DUF11 domain-containing protein, partial [Pseudomonadota bacterium]|nr:DUF11 domain-containing protein [Pseudomonadota bacterium]